MYQIESETCYTYLIYIYKDEENIHYMNVILK